MMDCRQVKQLLPLWIGQDLPDANSTVEVASHLEQCPECEKRRISLQSSMDVMQVASIGALLDQPSTRSLWPQLASQISDWERLHRRERFNGWIPASVMSLAVALMVGVSLPSIQDEFFGAGAEVATIENLFDSVGELKTGEPSKISQRKAQLKGGPAVAVPVDFKLDQW